MTDFKMPLAFKVRPVCPGVDYRPFRYYKTIEAAERAARRAFNDKVCTPYYVEIDRSDKGRRWSPVKNIRLWETKWRVVDAD